MRMALTLHRQGCSWFKPLQKGRNKIVAQHWVGCMRRFSYIPLTKSPDTQEQKMERTKNGHQMIGKLMPLCRQPANTMSDLPC